MPFTLFLASVFTQPPFVTSTEVLRNQMYSKDVELGFQRRTTDLFWNDRSDINHDFLDNRSHNFRHFFKSYTLLE